MLLENVNSAPPMCTFMDTTAQRSVLVVCHRCCGEEGAYVVHCNGAAISGSGRQRPLRTGACRGNAGEHHEGVAGWSTELHNARVMGTLIESIIETGDREKLSAKLLERRKTIALRQSVLAVEGALKAAKDIGYAEKRCTRNGSAWKGQTKLILINPDLRDWKEVEYRAVRDAKDICITVSG
ncbi:putative protein URA2 [CHAIN 0] [Phytophthora infestans]|uniref:Uncharacterized protein n=1 Tax=Phytophthora infestans TaxID=4787 RepID=A0A8S9UTP9_PHYIN|nr:putative protein URA2 [CHAIN 0] [Phytophthora infestans]